MAEKRLYVTHRDDLAECKARMDADGYGAYNMTERGGVQLNNNAAVHVVTSHTIETDDGWLILGDGEGFLALMAVPAAEVDQKIAELESTTKQIREFTRELMT